MYSNSVFPSFDFDDDVMASSFPQYCATCETQIVTPNPFLLYCSQRCRRQDANDSVNKHATRFGPGPAGAAKTAAVLQDKLNKNQNSSIFDFQATTLAGRRSAPPTPTSRSDGYGAIASCNYNSSYPYDPVRVRAKFVFGGGAGHSRSKSLAGTKSAITTITSATDSYESAFQASSAPASVCPSAFDGSYPFGMADDADSNGRPKSLREEASEIDKSPPVDGVRSMPPAHAPSGPEPVVMHGYKQDVDPTEWKPKERGSSTSSSLPPPEKPVGDGSQREASAQTAAAPNPAITVGDFETTVKLQTPKGGGNEKGTETADEHLPSWLPTLYAKAYKSARNGSMASGAASTTSPKKNRAYKSAAHDYLSRFQCRQDNESLGYAAAAADDDLRYPLRRGSSTDSISQPPSLTTSTSASSAGSRSSASTQSFVSEHENTAFHKTYLSEGFGNHEEAFSSSAKDLSSSARSAGSAIGLSSSASSLSSDHPLMTPPSSFGVSPSMPAMKTQGKDHHIDLRLYELEE